MRQPVVGVDHQLDVAADRVAHRLDDRDVLAPVGVVEAELDGPHAGVAQRRDAPGALLGLDQLAARGVGEQPLAAAAEQTPQRLAQRAADEVPGRDLGGPRPPAVEVDRLADLADQLRAARVEPDEQALEQRGVGQVVAARVALVPSSERTITSAASMPPRGTGSHAARNGGSSVDARSGGPRPPRSAGQSPP